VIGASNLDVCFRGVLLGMVLKLFLRQTHPPHQEICLTRGQTGTAERGSEHFLGAIRTGRKTEWLT
jgi:hypothetical protein